MPSSHVPLPPAMRLRLPLLLATAALSSACLEPLPTPDGRFGTITATAIGSGGTYVMKPEAAFYDKTDLSFSTFPNDTCVIAAYVPTGTLSGGLRTLNAGEFLFTAVSGRVDTLAPTPGLGIRVYTALRASGIPYLPGDTLSLTVPGAAGGFPASAARVKTSEAFTHDAIGVPGEAESLNLTWTAASSGGSRMTFSLRYANPFALGQENEQLFCSFVDDGSAVVAPDFLNGWRTSVGNIRSTRVARIRWTEVVIDDRTRLSLVSTFARPLPTTTE